MIRLPFVRNLLKPIDPPKRADKTPEPKLCASCCKVPATQPRILTFSVEDSQKLGASPGKQLMWPIGFCEPCASTPGVEARLIKSVVATESAWKELKIHRQPESV
jgi:hypothetical protein